MHCHVLEIAMHIGVAAMDMNTRMDCPQRTLYTPERPATKGQFIKAGNFEPMPRGILRKCVTPLH